METIRPPEAITAEEQLAEKLQREQLHRQYEMMTETRREAHHLCEAPPLQPQETLVRIAPETTIEGMTFEAQTAALALAA